MTVSRDINRLIGAFLEDGPAELPDRSFEAVRHEIERTRQRRPIGAWRIPRMSASARLLTVAAVVLIAFVGVSLLGPRGERASSPPPTEAPTEAPTDVPTSSPQPTPSPPPGPETPPPGAYELEPGFPVPVTIELPAGWVGCSQSPLEQGVCDATGNGAGLGFMVIDNVVADPCVDVGLDPPVGPTVDDLANAIAALPGFEATPAVDVTVDGHPGKELTVTAPVSSSCSLLTWMGPARTNGVGLGEANRLRIVDVDSTRVLVAAAYHPPISGPDIPPALEQVLESVRFPSP